MEQLTRQEVVTAWYGFGLWWGTPCSQNAKGHVVRAVACLSHRVRAAPCPPTRASNHRILENHNSETSAAPPHLSLQVGHVKDLGLDPDDDSVRVYATHIAQPWHVDDSELVALLCLKTAKVGGRSGWASSAAVYNRLLEARPDLVEVRCLFGFGDHG